MNEDKINNLIDQKIQSYASSKQFGIAQTPFHTHNGIDSPKLVAQSSGVISINGDTAPAQTISGGTDISASTSSGKTTIAFTGTLPTAPFSYATAPTSNTSSSTQNVTNTFTCGFQPRVITIYYVLNGTTDSGTPIQYSGVATYNGTTIASNLITLENLNSTLTTKNPYSFSTSTPSAGDGTLNSQTQIAPTAVTGTTFTITTTFHAGSTWAVSMTGAFMAIATG